MLERERIEEELEKKLEQVEQQGELSHEDLCVEIKELQERGCQDKWTIFGLITCMEQMEARMNLLHAQVMMVSAAPVVNLTREEDEGGVGGLIELGSPFRYRSPCLISPLELDEVTAG